MPDRIRYSRWPQALTWAFLAALFLCGWWVEERFLQPPGWQRPLGQLTTGEYDVQRVVDGDTIVLEQDNLRVRLQGVDSPETFTKNSAKQDAAIETWGLEATELTKQFLEDSNWHVQLVIDGEPIDRSGLHLAFVWRDGRLLNEELVQQGLARAKTTHKFKTTKYNRAMKKRLQKAQVEAQAAQRGIWSEAL